MDTSGELSEGELFRQVVEMAPNAMILVDEEGVIELVNFQAEQVFGYARAELLGRSIDILLPQRNQRDHCHYRRTFCANPTPRAMGVGRELFGLRKDGSEFPVEIALNPLRTSDGFKVLSAIVDISERRMQEEQFRQVVEMAPNAMIMIDKGGMIELVNLQAEKIFGYTRIELLGQSIDILLPERFRDRHSHYREIYFASSSSRAMGVGRELFGLRKDGSEFPVEIGLNPIMTGTGVKVLSAIVDISERKQSDIRQQQLIGELTRINEELNNFAYVSSHDLKSPLRGIDQLATWITEDLHDSLNKDTQAHLRLMRSRIKRMEMLLDDLLAYSKVGRSKDEIVSVDTNELVRDIFDLTATTKSIQLHLDQSLPILSTRKVPLELIFRNLIGNAIKHHDKASGRINISARTTAEGTEFSVTDDGPGIAPEHQQRVFSMFQTLKPRDEVEGSGIGLALVKKAVEAQGGRVALDSDGKSGSTFRFIWPS
ncbi:PAS domain S-box protein [Herbaspirillum sp. RV1423]|uniref:sensor histidine kinase n=1 Tax=Herbaspirillum sp. RV1423 TaxID=1443993 RepID=UPI0004BA3053|nr:PAS domain-containing sensor histidine kinase [Herbaspirillum sp. RV1423]